MTTYPVHVQARLDPRLSRWLWLVKWLLAIPHYLVLFALWVAFAVLSVVAFFAILVTGRYPRAIFAFNVGVLRWSWRVAYYAYGALGTDRYPPFTLQEVADYPAHLEIAYPEHLSRGLVLVKWWLLAIPHYILVAIFLGGATTTVRHGARVYQTGDIGLITALVLISAFALLFTGRYPRALFDLVLGLNRWVLRVAAYAGLMTDSYPPFRLDLGEDDGALTVAAADTSTVSPPAPDGASWSGGRIVALVVGVLLTLASLGLLGAGGAAAWADRTQRDGDGYLSTPVQRLVTPSHALVAEPLDLGTGTSSDWNGLAGGLGTVRLRVTGADPEVPVFVGIARRADVDRWLAGTGWARVERVSGPVRLREHLGGPPAGSPVEQTFWVARSDGTGVQSLTWKAQSGAWAAVAMNADGRAPVAVRAEAGATLPAVGWVAVVLLVVGAVLLVGGTLLIVLPLVRTGEPGDRGLTDQRTARGR